MIFAGADLIMYSFLFYGALWLTTRSLGLPGAASVLSASSCSWYLRGARSMAPRWRKPHAQQLLNRRAKSTTADLRQEFPRCGAGWGRTKGSVRGCAVSRAQGHGCRGAGRDARPGRRRCRPRRRGRADHQLPVAEAKERRRAHRVGAARRRMARLARRLGVVLDDEAARRRGALVGEARRPGQARGSGCRRWRSRARRHKRRVGSRRGRARCASAAGAGGSAGRGGPRGGSGQPSTRASVAGDLFTPRSRGTQP